jgi:ABC-2 type transport system permease protein
VAVYKHEYQTYRGPLTNLRFRFLVIPRHAFRDLFGSKVLLLLFLTCFLAPLVAAGLIYLHHNAKALQVLQLPVEELIPINAAFFQLFLWIQSFGAFLLSTLIGPGLISPDLTNNALPLYLSRPLTRRDYVIGKMSVLVILLSAITWAPLTLLYLFQSGMEGIGWFVGNLRILTAIWVGSSLLILVISLLALALSAWVKWRPVAGALLMGVFFVGAGFGAVVNQVLYTKWGYLLNITVMLDTAWNWMFGRESAVFELPVWRAFFGLALLCAFCLLLLSKKLKAYEVVRS